MDLKIADKLHNDQFKAENRYLKKGKPIIDNKLLPNQYFKKNPNLKRAGLTNPIRLTPEQILELKKCSKNPKYFINNYCYIINLDEGIVKFKTREYQNNLIDKLNKHNRIIVKFPRQSGKALALDTPILTKNGWSTIGEVKVGDIIYGKNGKETNITFITETMYDHGCYKITFDHGEEIVADEDHLWEVNHSDWTKKNKILTTKGMVKKYNTLYINTPKPIEYKEEKDLYLDPYFLGYWLGDGHSYSTSIFSSPIDLDEVLKHIPYKNYLRSYDSENCDKIYFHNIHDYFKWYDLFKNKHIPEDYLRSSIKNRIELLRGLMDSDGNCCKEIGSCEFYNKNLILINNVRELLFSLGIKNRIREKEIDGVIHYTVSFSTSDFIVFHLKRKSELQLKMKNHPKNKRIHIHKIEKVDSVPVRCLQVDNHDHMFLVGKNMIPTHNTVSTAAYVVWQSIFQPYSAIAILANKAKTAIGILNKVSVMYENLPKWIQIGVKEWNKSSIVLENGSRIEASATSSSAIRSMSISTLIIDECAFIDKGIWYDFFASVYPTVSSSKKAKIVLISTPNGMNHFYKFWNDAYNKKSDFEPYEIEWNTVPGRNEEFRDKVVAEFGQEYWNQEFACEFLGSAGTLISGTKLKSMVWIDDFEVKLNDKLRIYEQPIKRDDDEHLRDGKYILIFDTGEGVGSDDSTVHVFNVDTKPYNQVAVYRDNNISIRDFPLIVDSIGKMYNDALVIGENNTIGAAVLDDLFYDYEYENIFFSIVSRKKNTSVDEVNDEKFGIRMTTQSKKIGCSNLKRNIEDDYFQINDFHTIQEFTCFIKKGDTYKAEEGKHDDLITPLVIFSYFLRRREWVEMWLDQTKEGTREELLKQIESDLLPMGFVCDDGVNIESLDSSESDDYF